MSLQSNIQLTLVKYISFFWLLCINSNGISTSLNAQSRAILRDLETNVPIVGAQVQLIETRFTAISDSFGLINFGTEEGTFEMHIQATGYQTIKQQIQLSKGHSLELWMIINNQFLDVLTITATKNEKPIHQITSSIEVIHPDFIKQISATNGEYLLDKVPGIAMMDGQVNIRGGSGYSYGAGSRVMLLIDDMPALQVDAGLPNWKDIPMESIHQVEVLKGASSTLYGSAALNGIVHFRTEFARMIPKTKVYSFATIYDGAATPSNTWWESPPLHTGIGITHSRKAGKWDLVGGVFYNSAEEYKKYSYDRFVRLNHHIRYRYSDRLQFGLRGNFVQGKSQSFLVWKNNQPGGYLPLDSNLTQTKKTRFYIDPVATYFDKWGSSHRLYTRYGYVKNINLDNQSNQSNFLSAEYLWNHTWTKWELDITAGVHTQFSSSNSELFGNSKYSGRNSGLFTQLECTPIKGIHLSGGVRVESDALTNPYSIIGLDTLQAQTVRYSRPILRFGMTGQLAQATYLRASYGQGYRFPTIAEKFIYTTVSGIPIVPNPKLESETGWSGEIGLKQGFSFNRLRGFLDLAFFNMEFTNMIEFAVGKNFSFQAQNIGNTRINGLDFSWMAEQTFIKHTFQLSGGYMYLNPKYKVFGPEQQNGSSDTNNILKYRYRHAIKLNGQWKYQNWILGMNYQFNSRVQAIDKIFLLFIPGVSEFYEEHNHGFDVFDVQLGYQLMEGLNCNVLIRNLFNEEYVVRPAQLEAPRSVTLRFDWEFNHKSRNSEPPGQL